MQVWAWGANSNGQCGLGYLSEQVPVPTEVPIMFPSPKDKRIKQTLQDYPDALPIKIDGGSSDAIFLVENLPFQEPFLWQPNFQILPYPKVRDIACGWDFSLYLSKEGVLHSKGSNSHSQLGRKFPSINSIDGESNSTSSQPTSNANDWGSNKNTGDFEDQSLTLELTQVAAGLRHGVVTTSTLDMLVWGGNSQNQIGPSMIAQKGNDGTEEILVPMKTVTSPKFATVLDIPSGFETGFTHIACGKDFTLACDKEGFLYGCGANKYGTMGKSPEEVKGYEGFTRIFEQIPNQFFPGNVAEVKCGWGHVVCLLDTGKVVTWGRNDLGQLGRDSLHPKFDFEPKTLPFQEKIIAVACGSEHSLALGNSGAVYSWGWNEHDNCGVPSNETNNGPFKDFIPYPVKVNIPCSDPNGRVQAIGCGAGSSYAVTTVYY